MPTPIRQAGFDVVIRTKDHEPPHVHVFKGGASAKIELEPIALVKESGMSKKDLRAAIAIVANHQASLLETWRRIHG
jgi:hypothetical protein